jgi:hypothetical protein
MLGASLFAVVVGGISAASATPPVGDFAATLDGLNTDASGTVALTQRGTHLTVHLQASGLDDGAHVAHIHGVRKGSNACPTADLDTDGNGLVDFPEGMPAYGPVQITLSDGLNDQGTTLDYTRDRDRTDAGDATASLGSMDSYVAVVHGVDLNGDGVANNPDVEGDGPDDHDDNEITMPALCGPIG